MRVRFDIRASKATALVALSLPGNCAMALLALALVTLAVVPAPAEADISDPLAGPSWTSTFGGVAGSFDMANDVKIGSSGAVYVCGHRGNAGGRFEATLAKYVNGALAWGPKAYDGPGARDDVACSIALGSSSAVYTVGYSSAAPDAEKVLLIKWSAKTGNVIWVRRYDDPAHVSHRGYFAVVDPRGNVTIAGYSAGSDGKNHFLLRSWTAAGKVRWTWRSGWAGVVHGMVRSGDGSLYATGYGGKTGTSQAVTIRMSPAGKLLWSRFYAATAGESTSGDAITARPGGGVYVAGWTMSPLTSHDGFVLKYTPRGARTVFALDQGPGGATTQGFNDVAVTATKHIVAVGYAKVGANQQPHWVVYTPAGATVSKGTMGSAADDNFDAVATDAFGGYYMAGTRSIAAGDRRLLTMRRSTLTGGGSWTSLSGSVSSPDVGASAIAVRGTMTVVAGYSYAGPAAGVDQLVAGFPY